MTDRDLSEEEITNRLVALIQAEARWTAPRIELGALRAQIDMLVELLVARGVLSKGHHRLLAKVADTWRGTAPRRVHLRVLDDKYRVPNPDIDCASLLHLCHGRCCSFTFELSQQDLDEGKVRWEIDDPYIIRHGPDGFCHHLERGTGGCTVYEHRPAACRAFDCREDKRVWIDYEKRIPAPMPDGLAPFRKG